MTTFLPLTWLWTLMTYCVTVSAITSKTTDTLLLWPMCHNVLVTDNILQHFTVADLSNNSFHTNINDLLNGVKRAGISEVLKLKCSVAQTSITCCCRGNAELIFKRILWLHTVQGFSRPGPDFRQPGCCTLRAVQGFWDSLIKDSQLSLLSVSSV